MSDFTFKNEFLNVYLAYVEETESPRIAHIWSALTSVAACLGRRVQLPCDIGDTYANMYTVLVGPPSIKKSTAMKIAAKLVKQSTDVRFAPDDTGGQRQGLAAAMQGTEIKEEMDFAQSFDSVASSAGLMQLGDGVQTNDGLEKLLNMAVDIRDRHTMFATASELNSFIGHNNFDMLTFLIKVWDGDDFEYRLKTSEMILKEPLLTLIGCTTPTNIAEAMPQAAMGQGFMSRVILVHADKRYKRVRKPKLNMELEPVLKRTFSTIFNTFNGNMLDNRRRNLRVCTSQENRFNSKTHMVKKHSQFKGVHPNKDKWRAVIMHNRKYIHIGTFLTPEEAARAYDAKATELFGEFANLNFPKEAI